MQGREDSNPRRAVLEAAVLAAELRPYIMKNRPSGSPADGSRYGPVVCYPGAFSLGTTYEDRHGLVP